MVDSKTMSALGSARGEPNEAYRRFNSRNECSLKRRQIELERVKSQSPACSRIMNTPPRSLMSSFEASRSSENDAENRLATAAFVPTLWGQHVVILHWEGTSDVVEVRWMTCWINTAYWYVGMS